MLQRNGDGNRGQRRDFFPHHPVQAGLRLRGNKSRDMADRLSINYGRQGGYLHLAGEIDVVSRVGLRKVLTVFRERGKPGDGYQQKQYANFQAKPPVRCSLSKQAFRLWGNVHAQARRSSGTGITLSTADGFSFILRLLGFRKQELGCKVCASCERCLASSVWYWPGWFLSAYPDACKWT
jgi:hypothetical protein